ncbi:very long-chain-fatty-acid--CoA ligase bubblegum isoform X2 [Anabrus simplex]|uniref:very long-chain-fatty-acid--CoA ligase bubblegum isoform X2 n=1 Tax=Anabrus simplex TaxID=316456 RepID=UPI0035A34CD5
MDAPVKTIQSSTVTTEITKSSAQEIFKQNGNYSSHMESTAMDPTSLTNGNKITIQQTKLTATTTSSKPNQETTSNERNYQKSVPEEAASQPAIMKVETIKSAQVVGRSKYLNGPDQVIPANEITTTYPEGQVKLSIDNNGIAAKDPISVPGLLRRAAQTFPEVEALAVKDNNGKWRKITYGEYERAVRTCAKAFLKLGLKRHHSVCILGFNSPEWFISDLAAICAGGFAAGIYTTNSPEACFHCADSSRANIIVVEDDKQLQKILLIKDRLPELKAIVQYSGKPQTEGVYSWDEVMKIGGEEPNDKLEQIEKSIAINECCTLVYTSGTVGVPKAVMLSHDNLTWTSYSIASLLDLKCGSEAIISYLPLSHVAAQGSLVQTLQEVRPTFFLGVPRVWEKINEKMMLIGSQASGVRKAIASWAKSHGLQHNMNRMNGINSRSFSYTLASLLIFRRIKQALGLDRCRTLFSAAAPLSVEVKKYFMSLDMPVMEVFGMSESSGPHTVSLANHFKLDSIGKTLPGLQTVIHNPDGNGEGEICMIGRNVFMGYLNDVEKTKETVDQQGRLHSGDTGKMDEDGFVYITGRIKEIIITAGGENIPPVLIEQILKTELPCISNAVLIGDKRKFLSILLTLKTEMNTETGEPLDELSPMVKAWCNSVGSSAEKVSDIINGPDVKVMTAIQNGIDRLNTKAISNAQKVQKFALLPKDFSITTGELGPTMKVKRNVVAEKYADIINRFYTNNVH